MSDALVTEVVRGILRDPALVAALRDALGLSESETVIGHQVAAERWGVKPATVAGWCRDGLIEAEKRGRVWLVSASAERPGRRSAAQAPAPSSNARPRQRRRGRSSVSAAMRGQ